MIIYIHVFRNIPAIYSDITTSNMRCVYWQVGPELVSFTSTLIARFETLEKMRFTQRALGHCSPPKYALGNFTKLPFFLFQLRPNRVSNITYKNLYEIWGQYLVKSHFLWNDTDRIGNDAYHNCRTVAYVYT
jgi:hypothetical protein